MLSFFERCVVMDKIENKILGCLYGQAIGDALGFGGEALDKAQMIEAYPEGLTKYDQIIQDERHSGWPVGMWTDDTYMMIPILNCFVNEGHINKASLAAGFLDFYEEWGHTCGQLTRKALNFAPPIYKDDPISVSKLVWTLKGCDNAPNGGLMRTSVIGCWPVDVEENAALVCQMTHYDPRCVGSCVVISRLIHEIIWNGNLLGKDELIEIASKYDERIAEWITLAYENKVIGKLQLDCHGSEAYTLRTMAAALWAYWHAPDFASGMIAVINEGGDGDTNGAVACAVLGAKYGYNSIPAYYIENLYQTNRYQDLCNGFISKAIDLSKSLRS